MREVPVHFFLYQLKFPDDPPGTFAWEYHSVEVGYPGLDHLMHPHDVECHGTPPCTRCEQVHDNWISRYRYIPAYMHLIS